MSGTALQLASPVDGIRLTLHVLAAAVWVGGQVTMLGLTGPAKTLGVDAPRTLARAFNKLAWPAYGVLFLTGMWNLAALHSESMGEGSGMQVDASTSWNAVFGIKMVMFLLAGVAAFLHTRATSKTQLAIWGSVSGTASLVALALGVFVAG
jgi:putative copper export protein